MLGVEYKIQNNKLIPFINHIFTSDINEGKKIAKKIKIGGNIKISELMESNPIKKEREIINFAGGIQIYPINININDSISDVKDKIAYYTKTLPVFLHIVINDKIIDSLIKNINSGIINNNIFDFNWKNIKKDIDNLDNILTDFITVKKNDNIIIGEAKNIKFINLLEFKPYLNDYNFSSFVARFFPFVTYDIYINMLNNVVNFPPIDIDYYFNIETYNTELGKYPSAEYSIIRNNEIKHIKPDRNIFIDFDILFYNLKQDKNIKFLLYHRGIHNIIYFANKQYYEKYRSIEIEENEFLIVFNNDELIINTKGTINIISTSSGDTLKIITKYIEDITNIKWKTFKENIYSYDVDIKIDNSGSINIIELKNKLLSYKSFFTNDEILYNDSNKKSNIFLIYNKTGKRISITKGINYHIEIKKMDGKNENIIYIMSKIFGVIINNIKNIHGEEDYKPNIKKLLNYDRILFTDVSGNTFSRVVQKKNQPIGLNSEEELEEFKQKNKNFTYELRSDNLTNPSKESIYVCPDKKYKFPGFVNPSIIKNNNGACIPKCKAKSSLDDNKNKKIYNYCKFGNDITDANNFNNPNFIRKYKYDSVLDIGKYMLLPDNIDMYLNENKLLSPSGLLIKNSDIYGLICVNTIDKNEIIFILTENKIELYQNMHIEDIKLKLKNSENKSFYFTNEKSNYKLIRITYNIRKKEYDTFDNKSPVVKMMSHVINKINIKKERLIIDHIGITDIPIENITGQFINNNKITYVEINGKFSCPIRRSLPIKNVKNITEIKIPKYKDITTYLEKYKIVPVKMYYDINKKEYYGVEFSTNYISQIKPIKHSKITNVIMTYGNIFNLKDKKDDFINKSKQYIIEMELYNILKLELSIIVNSYMDDKIIKKMLKGDFYKNIHDFYKDNNNDYYIDDIISKYKQWKKTHSRNIDWNFAKPYLMEIEKIANEEDFEKMKKYIKNIVKSSIKIQSNIIKGLNETKIRNSCIINTTQKDCELIESTISGQCSYHNNKCKMVFPNEKIFNKSIEKIAHELTYQQWKRYEILNSKIERIKYFENDIFHQY